jgi:fibronectin type 3 domain-containing protein
MIPIPGPPENVRAETTQSAIVLGWNVPERNLDGSRPPKVIGYNVFRSETADQFPDRPLNEKPIAQNSFKDTNFEFGKTYYYAVSVVASTVDPYAESPRSQPIRVSAVDIFPPQPPTDVTVFSEAGEIRLVWTASPDADVAGYNVYRSETSGRHYLKLTASPVAVTAYKDNSVQSGKQYFYVVKAIDHAGNESAGSQEVSEVAK